METPGHVYTHAPLVEYIGSRYSDGPAPRGPLCAPYAAHVAHAPGGVHAVRVCGQERPTAPEKPHGPGISGRRGT